MIIVVGDLHVRVERPFYDTFVAFKDWFTALPLNNRDNTLILTGDIFHYPIPKSPDFRAVASMIFKDFKFKDIYICSGSHDYNRRYGNSLEVLSIFDNVHPILYPQGVRIEGMRFLFLPFFYTGTYKGVEEKKSMKEIYSSKCLSIETVKNQDFIIGHFFEEHEKGFGDYIDLSDFEGYKIFGHRHIPLKWERGEYIGTPYCTRYDEKGKIGYIDTIDIDKIVKSIEVPKFLDYFDIDFEKQNLPAMIDPPYRIWDVWNCPSKELAYEKYGHDIWIREIHKKVEEAGQYDVVKRSGKRTLKEYMVDYIIKEKVSKSVEDILLSLIGR